MFTEHVAALAHRHGWLVAHFAPARVTREGRQTYETAARFDGRGFPDLVLARADTVVLAELKARRGVLRPDQQRWVRAAGARVWRPADWQLIVTTLEGGEPCPRP
ncbi:MAG TPA: hypothetical protein VD866_32350 [Urbifossiella sp.]|nr:hypothetical protein [Urbifossiella sp.]